ncbi:MAG: substrate-binding domain-containing protein [Rhodoplanes sp.]
MTAAHVARVIAIIAGLAIGLPVAPGWAQGAETAATSLRGAGATFPAPLYKKWIAVYQAAHRNLSISYSAVGSGEGIKRFIAETVDFAASDENLTESAASKVEAGAATVPATAGMIVLAYNIPGVTGEVRLPRDVYADIFAGVIRRWNDRAFKRQTRAFAFRHGISPSSPGSIRAARPPRSRAISPPSIRHGAVAASAWAS